MVSLKTFSCRPLHRGFTILETIIVSFVLISFMGMGSKYITEKAEQTTNKITAQHLKRVTQAAQHYVQDHFKKIFEDLNKGLNFTLDLEDLKKDHYLEYIILKQNHYGQDYEFSVELEDGIIGILLYTRGGKEISEANLRKIAEMAGPQAGYITQSHPDRVVGSQENWSVNNVYGWDSGHLASLTMVNEKEVMDANNFLRRTKVSDHPEYNKMETDLQIDNVHKLFFEKDNGFSLTKYKLESKNQGHNSSIEIENSSDTYLLLKKQLDSVKLEINKLIFNSQNGSSISVNSGNNKFFEISHPGGEHMKLWSNYLGLYNDKNNNKIDLSARFSTDTPTISATGTGWGNISINSSVAGLTNYAEINPKFIKLPVYIFKDGEWGDGTSMVKNVCKVAGEGAMFLVRGDGHAEATLAVCRYNDSAIIIKQGNPFENSHTW